MLQAVPRKISVPSLNKDTPAPASVEFIEQLIITKTLLFDDDGVILQQNIAPPPSWSVQVISVRLDAVEVNLSLIVISAIFNIITTTKQ